MSTATPVPETWELTGDDAWRVLRTGGRRALLRNAFVRFRVADGFSHARSLAYATSLVFVQATIAIVGLASALGEGSSADFVRTIKAALPGPAGELLTQAVVQAHHAGCVASLGRFGLRPGRHAHHGHAHCSGRSNAVSTASTESNKTAPR